MFMRDANPVVEQLLGGWGIAGITNWHTGYPFTILANTATDFSGFNQFADRANIGSTPVTFNYNTPTNVFNKTLFSSPGAGNIGNTGRNAFYGPSYTDFDFSVQKTFHITE